MNHRIPLSNPAVHSLLILAVSFLALNGCHSPGGGASSSMQESPRNVALLDLSQNKWDEAELAFQKAIQLSPDSVDNYLDLSRLYLLKQNYSGAIQQATAGLKFQAANPNLQVILADAYAAAGDTTRALSEIQALLVKDPGNTKALYAASRLGQGSAAADWRKTQLLHLLALLPANTIVRMQLCEIYAASGKADSARFFLESIKKIAPEFSGSATEAFNQALSLLQQQKPAAALPEIRQFHQLLRLSPTYESDDIPLEFARLNAGIPSFVINDEQQISIQDAHTVKNTHFTLMDQVGLPSDPALHARASVLAVADRETTTGNLYVYGSFRPQGSAAFQSRLWVSQPGLFHPCTVIGGLDHPGQDLAATFADYDNDGYQDLLISTTRGLLVYHNNGDGTFSKIPTPSGLGSAGSARQLLLADLDQDGDLDLFLAAPGANRFYRNNGDGSFTEQAAAMGLSQVPDGALAAQFADWDFDGDLDLFTLNGTGHIQLFDNQRHARFSDITTAVGLGKPAYRGTALAVGDYTNDGRPDLLVAGGPSGGCRLLENTPQGFVLDPASQTLSQATRGIDINAVDFLDFDNDGHEDILVAGVNRDSHQSGLKLFHNDTTRGFSDVSYLLPKVPIQAYHAEVTDFDADGDRDIFLSGPSGLFLLRNDGGNINHNLSVQLVGLSYGNSKNNRLGIGARVELKAGDLFQMKTVYRPTTEFGMGARSHPDAVRIIWPNGVAQTVLDPGKMSRLIELEKLKGSCPFLFTWNGKRFVFVKDMLWRSVLGMPLSLHGRDTSFAFPNASSEYLLIPAKDLKADRGMYRLRITEELWEAVFLDQAKLIAVDHPDSVRVFADERFVPPPFPGQKVYEVPREYLPVSATDDRGTKLLAALSHHDFHFVSNFSLGKYQGLATMHDLILDLGPKARTDSVYLFLRGWIFPGDASTSMAEAQSHSFRQHPPELQVKDRQGHWKTVIDNFGFPMGRDKTVVVNLSGKFLSPLNRQVRIRTNLQIYWDQAFFSPRLSRAPLRMTEVPMLKARLHYRGYSASYRKGGPWGPEWFDYDKVSTGQKWRDLTGRYTRYGDVKPLLEHPDDEYVIADGGDELQLSFNARALPALKKGWTRDFLIYSNGWVKDGDLNTDYGQTVAPLPFHHMPSYPYPANLHYPQDPAHRLYMKTYNTRVVRTAAFRNALKYANPEHP